MAEMKQGAKRFPAILWLLMGVGLGIGLDRLFRPAPHHDPSSSALSETTSTKRPAHGVASNDVVMAQNEAPAISVLEKLRELPRTWSGTDLQTCLALIDQLPLAECRAAMALFDSVRYEERIILQRALARRWARLDADGLLTAALQLDDQEGFRLWSGEAVRELSRGGPDAALSKLLATPGRMKQLMLGWVMIPVLAESYPDRAGAFLSAHPEFIVSDEIVRSVSEKWGSSNPRAAIAWAMSLPKGRYSTEALNGAYLGWARENPESLVKEMLNAPDRRFDRAVVVALAENWSERDPRAALAWIATLPRQQDRENAWDGFTPDVRKLGPDGVFELLQGIGSDSARNEAASKVARQLAQEDPFTALTWADRFPAQSRARILQSAMDSMIMTDAQRVVDYVNVMPAGQARSELLQRAAVGWAMQDSDAALMWAGQIPAGPERQGLISEVISEATEFVDMSQWLKLISSESLDARAVERVAERWSRSDGEAAAQWVGQLTTEETQKRGYYAVGRQWAFSDSEATARWMGSMPAGPMRDVAIRGFVSAMDGHDPALAMTWASAIEEPNLRREQVLNTFNRLMQRDLVAAHEWLDRSKIDGPLRSDLTAAIQGGPR